jgi:hypothetical protein
MVYCKEAMYFLALPGMAVQQFHFEAAVASLLAARLAGIFLVPVVAFL